MVVVDLVLGRSIPHLGCCTGLLDLRYIHGWRRTTIHPSTGKSTPRSGNRGRRERLELWPVPPGTTPRSPNLCRMGELLGGERRRPREQVRTAPTEEIREHTRCQLFRHGSPTARD